MTELDPYPWIDKCDPIHRVNKPLGYNGSGVIFDPRPGYEQDESKYRP